MTVVGLDPGGTTGVALWDGFGEPECFQMGPMPHHRELYNWLSKTCPSALVVENFTWTPTAAALISVEYIGVCELYRAHRPGMAFERPDRSMKQFWSDDKIKALSLWLPGKPHAMDALRHLLYFVTLRMNNKTFVNRLRN